MDDLGVGDVVEVAALDEARLLEHPLGLFGAVLGEDDALLLLVLLVIFGDKRFHELVDADVEVRLVVGRARR